VGNRRKGALGRILRLEQFHSLSEELLQWRVDPQIEQMQECKRGGIILPFVKGLRLSARLIYAIRPLLPSGYQVDWGHLLTPDEESCSPECDIIIYKNGYVRRWNDHTDPVMDFKFVSCRNAIAVISCKSLLRSVDRRYCKNLKQYVSSVLLFAECCGLRDLDRLRKAAINAGYKGFWYLHAMTEGGVYEKHEKVWEDFLETVVSLVDHREGPV